MRGSTLIVLVITVLLLGLCGLYFLKPGQATAPAPADRVLHTELAGQPSPHGRPNVVLISLDTVRPSHLSVYGYPKPTSPKLEALARAGGVLFTHAQAQAPWTLPSHMAVFTSLLPSHARVEDLGQRLPAGIPTLAELLTAAGYHTAGLVNDGQMKAHWGFSRGYAQWREFAVDTPAGACDNITREALAWLKEAPTAQPWFLFLHYYDAHDPYEAPEAYRRQFGVTLTGEQTQQLLWHNRVPGVDLQDADLLAQLKAAYDAELAWLDAEVGKVLDALPANTLVVLFSDHGEAFDEHGWMTHGADLHQEEIHALLLMRPPVPGPPIITQAPVMLLDIAPTILRQCGVQPPATWQGRDLSQTFAFSNPPDRPQFSETTRYLEGIIQRSVTVPGGKGIYDFGSDSRRFVTGPGERQVWAEPPADLVTALSQYAAEGSYWLITLANPAAASVTITVNDGRLALAVPLGVNWDTDQVRLAEDGCSLVWETSQAAPQQDGGYQAKALYLQTATPGASLSFSGQSGDTALPIHAVAQSAVAPDAPTPAVPGPGTPQPVTLKPAGQHLGAPVRRPILPGLYPSYHHGTLDPSAAEPATLDADTLRQLRALGYAH